MISIASFLDPWHLHFRLSYKTLLVISEFPNISVDQIYLVSRLFCLVPVISMLQTGEEKKNLETRLTGVFTFLLVCSQTYSVQENNR